MPIICSFAFIAALLRAAVPSTAATAMQPAASLVAAGALPSALAAIQARNPALAASGSGVSIEALIAPPATPHKGASAWREHRDLDDIVRDWLGGGRITFYFGNNLARGDISGVKTLGLKFYF